VSFSLLLKTKHINNFTARVLISVLCRKHRRQACLVILLWILSIKTDYSLYFSWQYIRVDMVDNVPEDNHGIMA